MGNQVVNVFRIGRDVASFQASNGPLGQVKGQKLVKKQAFFLVLEPKMGSKFSGPPGGFPWRVHISNCLEN